MTNPPTSPELEQLILDAVQDDDNMVHYCEQNARCDKGDIFDPGRGEYGEHVLYAEQVTRLKANINLWHQQQTIAVLERLSMAMVEPCEPDCDDVRHARHEGIWNAHLIVEEEIRKLKGETL